MKNLKMKEKLEVRQAKAKERKEMREGETTQSK